MCWWDIIGGTLLVYLWVNLFTVLFTVLLGNKIVVVSAGGLW